MEKIEFKIDKDEVILKDEIKKRYSKKLYKNIKSTNSLVYVNNKEFKMYNKVYSNDIITIYLNNNKKTEFEKINENLDILFEDENYIVCYKKDNLLTIPIKKEPYSLFQILLGYTNLDRVSILTRLDKETKGLVLVCKNRISAFNLQPVKSYVKRKYLCVVKKDINSFGIINKKIKKDDNSIKRYISDDGKESITIYKKIKEYKNYAILEVELLTGRTHQIRVHLSSIGYPIVGDKLYNGTNYKTMLLESYYISFLDKEIKFSKMDEYIKELT